MVKAQVKPSIEKDLNQPGMDRIILFGLAAYFLVSIFIRVIISSTAEMDETEQLIYTQTLKLGYGAQLPLYVWLQHLFFTLLGVNIFALSSLKYTLLFSTYICVHRIAQKALNDNMGAMLATLSLFLVPQIVWESYRTLTNTVLVTLLAAITLLVLLKLREDPTTMNYLLLGTAAGLGMLSKYNYAIFFLTLISAGLTTTAFRKCLLSARSVLSLGVMILITAPPYIWIVSNLDTATASSKKLKVLGGDSLLVDMALGLSTLIASWIGYFWPAFIVYAVFYFFFKPVRPAYPEESIHRLLTRILVYAFTVCSLLVLFFNVTYFKERWMQPLLFFLPIFFMYYLATRLNRKRFRGLLAVTLTPALFAMALFSGGVLLASKADRATRLSPPYRTLAEGIQEEGFTDGTIITNDHRIGGNFRLHFKGSTVLVSGMMDLPFDSTRSGLIIWNANKSNDLPENLAAYAEERIGVELDMLDTHYVEEPLMYWEGKTMELGYIIIPGQ